MTDRYHENLVERIRALASPVAPRPTDTAEALTPLPGIKAVIFDVYGTMIISGCGDVGTSLGHSQADCLSAALGALGVKGQIDGAARAGIELYPEVIREHHVRRRENGIEYPEVEIRDVWRDVIARLDPSGLVDVPITDKTFETLAIEYEGRANPVWPMPGLGETLDALRSRGTTLGIVSNAQFFTPLLFEALLDATCEELGFDDELCVWSFEHLEGKPSVALFQLMLKALEKRGIKAQEALYVGNDIRNDIGPASTLGMKTALFAADRRSLRLRKNDARCVDVRPDVVLTALSQIVSVLET
jgi:putative hydrolase of the HAD superfamily